MFKKIFSQLFTFSGIFFKEMAVACSIFTLGGWVQLFWMAFDLMFTVVPLKVVLGWHKFDFCAFQKNNLGHTLARLFFETPKNLICAILMQLLMVSL